MKRGLLLLVCFSLISCNSLLPYKGQSLEDLNTVIQSPEKYQGHIVSFAGEIRGITENDRLVKFVLKVETPLYYYATGKDPLSYQLLLVNFEKQTPQNTNLVPGKHVKILARVDQFKTRYTHLGMPVAVLHLQAIALADRETKIDFFHTQPPDFQLYESWKQGRLFFKETPQQVIAQANEQTLSVPAEAPARPAESLPIKPAPTVSAPEPALIFEEEEPFLLTPTED